MLTFTLLYFSLLLLFTITTTTAQSYENPAVDSIFINCGSSTRDLGERWDGDENSKFLPSNFNTSSFSSQPDNLDPSVPETPYSSARIFNTSSFTYTFPVSEGPKFLRLYFYPATYSSLTPNQSFFSVSSNGYSLLTNFSAFLAASFLAETSSNAVKVPNFVKEYIIYVKETKILNVTFTPSPNSYAFINGVEIVPMPENLYFNSKSQKYVGSTTGPFVTNDTVLENICRLNMGGGYVSGNDDSGMYRTWDPDNNYIYSAAVGCTHVYQKPITYTSKTPNYTAPELVYQTQRSMGIHSDKYNLTWILPVDSRFYYIIRLHFCNIIEQYTKQNQVVFKIFINNQTAENEFDLVALTQGIGYPLYEDYLVYVNDPDGSRGKQDLWVAMHPKRKTEQYWDAYLNGLEAFKVSMNGNLSGPNPELRFTTPPIRQKRNVERNKKKPPYAIIIGCTGGVLVVLFILVLIVFQKRRRAKHYIPAYSEPKYSHSPLPSDRCRRFSLKEVEVATFEFNDEYVIGKGGFGKVYKGYVDDATIVVAIKRLNELSNQGAHEFRTEIWFLSNLRHVHLVSLIGYCVDQGEMILVYDYMPNGTLREHLYKNNNPPLSWKRRLRICIGAAKGLHYLHTGLNRAIIHRDVKSTNILLDENWVAKLSDFGLSKLGPNDQAKNHVSTVVKGTIGYMDPEYCQTRQLTEKSDVYSFGAVLLEVLCGRPVINSRLPDEQVNLAELGKFCYRKGTLHEIIDLNLSDEIAPKCLMKFGEVAHSCLKKDGTERPTMEEVVCALEFALQLQEAAEKTGGETLSENQKLPLLIQIETTTDDDDVSTGSSAKIHGTSSTSSNN